MANPVFTSMPTHQNIKAKNSPPVAKPSGMFYPIALLALILLVLFWRSFLPDFVHFSNDGPLGQINAAATRFPQAILGVWSDLNYLGGNGGSYTPDLTMVIRLLLSPVAFAKFYPAIVLFILGLAAWTFFRQLKLSPLACALGTIAAALNSTFFSSACWGVGTQEMAVALDFFALALIAGCTPNTPTLVRWSRFLLAGLCVGMNVMEGADIGALFSLLVAIFVLFHAWVEADGAPVTRAFHGVARVAVIAVFAMFIAVQTVLSLVGTSIQGVVGASQDVESRAARWDWATQWSLPKSETVGLLVPGVFGYKMNTPTDMMPFLVNAYDNGVYWGGVGRAPELDRYFDSGSHGEQPSGPNVYMRFTGGGNYCGVLVFLIAAWAFAQSLRRQNSAFSGAQKRMILFWSVVMFLCLLFAWGRFAPFYAILYQLPYFSTIRNPAKFLIFFSWALVIVFAYGVHALDRRYLDPAAKAAGLKTQLQTWWARIGGFDRKWTFTTLALLAASVLGCLIYASQKPALIAYLQKVGFPDNDPTHDNSAPAIFAFSLGQVRWFVLIFAIAVFLLLVLLSGFFGGRRAKVGAFLLGAFLVADLGRGDLPWIAHWDYKQKYEVGALNPVLQLLADKPYEHRVVDISPPFRLPPELTLFDALYRIEWTQHHFPFYNIQTLDIVQMPRPPEDMRAFREALAPRGDQATAPLYIPREWQLTNTRYLLGPAAYLDLLNELDPAQHRFRIAQRFDIVPKPGIPNPYQGQGVTSKQLAAYLPLEQVTAVPNDNGDYALFEFTGALPRAKIYSTWEVNTNDAAILNRLGDLKFDPLKTVLVSTPAPGVPAGSDQLNAGTVEYQSYSPTHVVLAAQNSAPAVLLLNDKFDPDWRVLVDGKPAGLLRCNFIMRGVYLPKAGSHTVDFKFQYPDRPLCVTLTAIATGVVLCGFLFYTRRRPAPAPAQP
jgi:hypothetical protein